MTEAKSGFVAIIGRPNVGKSTLLNELVGQKISITAPKPQTTRWQIYGIKMHGDNQIIYIDTPGLHESGDRAMNRYLNKMATAGILDADIIVFMIDALRWHKEDELVLNKLQHADKPVILAINKIDLIKAKADLLPYISKLQAKFNFAHIIPLSVYKHINIKELEDLILTLLPEGPKLFPEEQITDKSVRFQISEIIREKIIMATREELPYSTAVEIESFKDDEKLIEIGAIIWVERQGQKVIVVGTGGAVLKKIGIAARKEITVLLGKKIFLRLWVKVKADWTDDAKALKNLGYE